MGAPVILSTKGRERRLEAISVRGSFGDVGWQGAGGAEDRPDVARDRRSHGDALVVLLDHAALEPVDVAHDPVPFGLEARPGAAPLELLGKDERQERLEDVAADRGIAGMEDGAGVEGGLGGPEQGLHHEQLAVSEHRVERADVGVGPEHEDAIVAGFLGELAGIDLEGRALACGGWVLSRHKGSQTGRLRRTR